MKQYIAHKTVWFFLIFFGLPLIAGCIGKQVREPKAQEKLLTTVAEAKVQKETGTKKYEGAQEPEKSKDTGDSEKSQPVVSEFSDDFNVAWLDEHKWVVTRKNDFAEFAVDVVPVKDNEKDGQLRLRCGTIGTDDTTVKMLGVASREPLDLSGQKSLTLDLDWNNQPNGCYLTAAVYLCPVLINEGPAEGAQFFQLEYIGVPPGKNGRLAIWLKDNSAPRWIYNEGWPDKQRTGRVINRQNIKIEFNNRQWKIVENGSLLFDSQGKWSIPFDKAYLYLQMTSHSNYPPREIFFDNIEFK